MNAINGTVTGAWHVTAPSRFYKVLHQCMIEAPTPVAIVQYEPKGPVPDIVLDKQVGYVFEPANRVADRVVVLILVLFADRYNYLAEWCASSPSQRSTAGVPDQIAKLLERFRTARHTPINAPLHYGDDGGGTTNEADPSGSLGKALLFASAVLPCSPPPRSLQRLAEMTEETMARFNGMIADHPESLAAIRKEHDLVWTHGPFGEYNTIKVFPVKRHKKTGKLVDLPSSDMSGPGKMRIRFAYGQVGLLTQTPENMTNLEQPLESVLFMRPEDEGYDPVISAAFTEEMEYINNFLNEQRVK